MVAHVPAGETVGEMSLIAGDQPAFGPARGPARHRIAAHQPAGFEALIARHPRVMMNLMQHAGEAAAGHHRAAAGDGARPKTFAIVPLQDGLADAPIAHRLADALARNGHRAPRCWTLSAGDQTRGMVQQLSKRRMTSCSIAAMRPTAPGRICACARPTASSCWPAPTSRCRCARSTCPPSRSAPAGLPELLLLHPARRAAPGCRSISRCAAACSNPIIICAPAITADVPRLARFIAGRAVGLVLAGGGARGFAHIGIIKALMEAGVPFDHLGGTSMGAIIAAGLAQEWGVEELTERMREVFVTDNPLSDFTLPLIALVRGRKVSDHAARAISATSASRNCRKPFFCVSSDLTTGRIHVHRDGTLWRALRASVALPGILPPVTHHGHLLVDGGVMNNLPVDVMREHAAGAGPDHRLRRHRRNRSAGAATTAMASGPGGG